MADLEVIVEGNKRIVRASFRVPAEPTGVLTDPTAVTFTARKRRERGDALADYEPTEYVFGAASEVTKQATGIFVFEFLPGEGTWHVHVQGTEAAHAAGEIAFVVDRAEALVQS